MMALVERRARKKRKTPWWDERPILPAHLEWVWRAWGDLDTCRRFHMGGEGPIPWTAVHEWARCRRMGEEEEAELWAYISAMDAEYLTREKEK